MSAETVAEKPQKKTIKTNTITYDARTGRVYKIWLLNLFMNIITLGIYSFWGKTRLRQYVASSFSLGGDRFEYTGTGMELFKGFLKAFLIYMTIIIVYGLLSFGMALATDHEIWQALPELALYLIIIYLIKVAIYAAFRYRLSRTQWRGIRGYLSGSAFSYANFSLKRDIINILSLGFLIPHSDLAKHKYVMEHTHFGNVKADYEGQVKNIYKAHVVSYLFLILPFFVGLTIGGVLKSQELIKNAERIVEERSVLCEYYMEDYNFSDPQQCPELSVLREHAEQTGFSPALSDEDPEAAETEEDFSAGNTFLGFFVLAFFPLIIIVRLWYRACLMREKINGLKVGDIRFKSSVTTWGLFKLVFGNMLILIFTLGIGLPIIMQRNMRFFADFNVVGGDLDTSEIMQAKNQKIHFGEGLDDALGLDTGLM